MQYVERRPITWYVSLCVTT